MSTATLAGPKVEGPAAAFPPSKYAINTQSGMVWFEVKHWKKTKDVTIAYVRRLTGHPGDWLRTKFNPAQQKWILEQLEQQTPATLAKVFADHFTCCAKCLSPLSDELSVSLGLGPVCREAFGL